MTLWQQILDKFSEDARPLVDALWDKISWQVEDYDMAEPEENVNLWAWDWLASLESDGPNKLSSLIKAAPIRFSEGTTATFNIGKPRNAAAPHLLGATQVTSPITSPLDLCAQMTIWQTFYFADVFSIGSEKFHSNNLGLPWKLEPGRLPAPPESKPAPAKVSGISNQDTAQDNRDWTDNREYFADRGHGE